MFSTFNIKEDKKYKINLWDLFGYNLEAITLRDNMLDVIKCEIYLINKVDRFSYEWCDKILGELRQLQEYNDLEYKDIEEQHMHHAVVNSQICKTIDILMDLELNHILNKLNLLYVTSKEEVVEVVDEITNRLEHVESNYTNYKLKKNHPRESCFPYAKYLMVTKAYNKINNIKAIINNDYRYK